MKNHKIITFLGLFLCTIALIGYGIGCDTTKEVLNKNSNVVAKVQNDQVVLTVSRNDLEQRFLNDRLVKIHMTKLEPIVTGRSFAVVKVGSEYMANLRGKDKNGNCVTIYKALNSLSDGYLSMNRLTNGTTQTALQEEEGETHSCNAAPCEECRLETYKDREDIARKRCACYEGGLRYSPDSNHRCNHSVTYPPDN